MADALYEFLGCHETFQESLVSHRCRAQSGRGDESESLSGIVAWSKNSSTHHDTCKRGTNVDGRYPGIDDSPIAAEARRVR